MAKYKILTPSKGFDKGGVYPLSFRVEEKEFDTIELMENYVNPSNETFEECLDVEWWAKGSTLIIREGSPCYDEIEGAKVERKIIIKLYELSMNYQWT